MTMRAGTIFLVALALTLASAQPLCAKKGPSNLVPMPADSLSLAVGTSFGHDIALQLERLRSLGIAVNLDAFIGAMTDQIKGQPGVFTVDAANTWLDNYIAATRPEDLPDVLDPASQTAFLDSVASLPGAVRMPDGLIMFVDLEGEGLMPTDADVVRVMYTGRFYNGQEFDATTQPIDLPVSGLAPGFSEGLKMMKPGGKYRLVIPAELAYGREGIPGAIPGNAVLDFYVNLLEIK